MPNRWFDAETFPWGDKLHGAETDRREGESGVKLDDRLGGD